MPTLKAADGVVYSPQVAAAPTNTKSTGAKPKPKPKPQDDSSPLPPPNVPELQLKMWRIVLKGRIGQMKRMSNYHLLSFATDIISDLLSSRYEANKYSKDLNQGEIDGTNGEENSNVDLIAGHYSSLLLTQQPPPTTTTSADEIGLHLLALFYRSVDDRLPSAPRKHGIDALRRAFQKMEYWMAKSEAGEKGGSDPDDAMGTSGGGDADPGSKKRKSTDSANNGGINTSQGKQRTEKNAPQSNESEGGSSKRMRKDPPELNAGISQGPERKDSHRGASQVSVGNGPPQQQLSFSQMAWMSSLRQDGNSIEKETDSASQRMNGNRQDVVPTQKASTATQKKPPEELDRSAGAKRKDPPELQAKVSESVQMAAALGAERVTVGSGKRILPPKPTKNNERQRDVMNSSTTSAQGGEHFGAKKAGKPEQATAPPSTTNSKETALTSQASSTAQGAHSSPIDKHRRMFICSKGDRTTWMAATKDGTAPSSSAHSPAAENTDEGKAPDNHDVIDLTGDDSPPQESSPAKAPSASNQAIKQSDEEHAPPSPPASPLPFATIHHPPPSPQPKPKPFSSMRRLLFAADKKNNHTDTVTKASGSLTERPSCAVTYDAGFHLDGSGSCMDDALCLDVSERLKTWDPYWKIVEV